MYVNHWLPVQVPQEYSNLPQLKGRATLEMSYVLNESRDSPEPVTRKMNIVLDGYNAPVSAGSFLDLVTKHWYDGMTVQRADGFVVQTGKPEGKAQGYVDPISGKERSCVTAKLRMRAYASFYCQSHCVIGLAGHMRHCTHS